MAVANADGTIILKTQIDQTGLKSEMMSMKTGIKSTSSALTKLGATISAVFSVAAIINFSKETSNLATTTEASAKRLVDIYGEASQAVGEYIDANARAIGMSKASAASFSAVYGNLFSVWADQTTNAELTNKYLNATSVVASKTGRTIKDVQERIRSGLLGNTEAVEDLGIFVNVKTIEITDAFKRIADGRSWEQLNAHEQSQVRALAILEQSVEKYGSQVAETTSLTKARYQAAWEDFENTWGQAVNTVLVPILEVATDVLSILTQGLQAVAGFSGETISQKDAIDGATSSQNALTDAVEETVEAQKKAVAGFDTINVLSSKTTDEASTDKITTSQINSISAITSLSNIGDTASESTGKVSGLQAGLESLFYETLGKINVTKVANVKNAFVKAFSSAQKYLDTFSFNLSSDLITDFFAKYSDYLYDGWTGMLTALSGYWDIQTAKAEGDLETGWKGLGKILGSGWITTIGWADFWGIEEIYGVDVEKLRNLFMPITEEVTNIYEGLSTEAAKTLQEVKSEMSDFNEDITALTWGNEIIEQDDIDKALASFDDIFDAVISHFENGKESAEKNLNNLVSKGLMTDEEAEKALENLNTTYKEQEKALKNSRGRISQILTNAKNQNRELTEAEKTEISKITKAAEEDITAVIKVGAADRKAILEELNRNTEALTSTRLSQIIQFANQERDEAVKTANETYEATIAEADKLYKELGVIDENRYNEIVSNAEKQRNAQVEQAEKARTELVTKAQTTAGEIADTVDPETGEILSNWEIIWNRAYDKVIDFAKDIQNIPRVIANYFIDGFNEIIDAINSVLFFKPPKWMQELATKQWGITFNESSGKINHLPRVPLLARGAVIPANRKFLAVLGDQKNGRNLEAPESLIRQIFREESGAKNFTITAKGPLAPIIRLLALEITEEQNRVTVF